MPYRNREAQREFQRAWLRRRRVAWLLENGPCVDCGRWGSGPDRVDGLEVDHRDSVTKVDHRIWSWSRSRREGELEKCSVRCHKCHVRIGIQRGQLLRGAVLDSDDVIAARVMAGRMTIEDLADVFGVVPATIASAVSGRTWSHVRNVDSAVYRRALDKGLV